MYYIYLKDSVVFQHEDFERILNWYRYETSNWYRSDNVFKKNNKLALTKQYRFDNHKYEFVTTSAWGSSYTDTYKRCYYVIDSYYNFINIWNYKDYILYDGGMPAHEFEYGHLCISGRYRYNNHEVYRFRIDPVPNVRKWRGGGGQKSEKTHQEKKLYFACEDKTLIRGKRSPSNIPNPWDEEHQRCIQKSWKSQSKSKHQNDFDTKKLREIKHYISEEYFEED